MKHLIAAQQLLDKTPYTIETCREFARLEKEAKGQEAEQIADLIPALIAGLDQATHMEAFKEGLV